MRLLALYTVLSIVLPAAISAHGGGLAMSKIFGRDVVSDLNIGKALRGLRTPRLVGNVFPPGLEARGNVDGACGPAAGGAVCAEGYCCAETVKTSSPQTP